MSCDGTCSGGDITGSCMLGLNKYQSGVYCGKYMSVFGGHENAGCPKWQWLFLTSTDGDVGVRYWQLPETESDCRATTCCYKKFEQGRIE